MTQNLEALMWWNQVCLMIAAVCTTSFPVIWAFSRWDATLLGKLLMLQAVAFALAVDLTAIFSFWNPGPKHLGELFLLNAVVLGLIALSTMLLTLTMIRMNYIRRKKTHERLPAPARVRLLFGRAGRRRRPAQGGRPPE